MHVFSVVGYTLLQGAEHHGGMTVLAHNAAASSSYYRPATCLKLQESFTWSHRVHLFITPSSNTRNQLLLQIHSESKTMIQAGLN